jgi:hypothetical protein
MTQNESPTPPHLALIDPVGNKVPDVDGAAWSARRHGRAMRLLRSAALVLTGIVSVLAVIVGAAWLYFAEPWYDNSLVKKFRAESLGCPGGPYQDHTSRIAGVFHNGMSRADALQILNSNGFSCQTQIREPDRALWCKRPPRWICRPIYEIIISYSEADVVTGSSARCSTDCF